MSGAQAGVSASSALPALRTSADESLRDVRADRAARSAAVFEAPEEPLAFRVALGDVSRDAILLSEATGDARGSHTLPAACTIPSLARTSCAVKCQGGHVIMEHGIYRLR